MNNLEKSEKPNNRPIITGIIILLILASLSYLALKINSKDKQEQTVTVAETDAEESDTHQNISNSTDPSTPTGLSEEEKKELYSAVEETVNFISKPANERVISYNDLSLTKEMKKKEAEQEATDHIPSNSTDPSTSTGLSEEEREQIYGAIIEFSDYLSKPIEEQVGKSKDLTTVKNYEKRKAEQEATDHIPSNSTDPSTSTDLSEEEKIVQDINDFFSMSDDEQIRTFQDSRYVKKFKESQSKKEEQTDEQTSSTSEEETTISSIWQEISDFFRHLFDKGAEEDA